MNPSRRGVLGGTVAAAAGAALPAGGTSAAPPAPSSMRRAATPPTLVAETRAGRVRGFVSDGIATFKGVPYGEVPARFMPARPPAPWPGIRTAFSHGPICPQPAGGKPNDVARFYGGNPEPGVPGEDCLRVNVWTPAMAGRRPVLVWIHGGGFETGSSHESVAYHGEAISRRGALVFVSITHRLGALGFLNLAAYGADYAQSANVGLADIVLALEWVRDNIAAFGGDPGAVTLIGQSGGGRKVSTLLAMPSAAGLFHRAILHSGSLISVARPDRTAALAAATLDEMGLSAATVDRLRDAPPDAVVAGYLAARKRFLTPSGTVFDFPYTTPTLDGTAIPTQPFEDRAPAVSARVPLLLGTTLHEQSGGRSRPELTAMTDGELHARVAKDYGARADEVIAVFRRAYPADRPFATLAAIEGVTPRRPWAIRQARLKAAQGTAPAYLFQFAWRTPMLDGAPLAHHGADLPFALYNIDRSVNATGGGPEARRLAGLMSDAWIAFVETGDPNHPGLPPWPAVTAERLPTMIFDTTCTVAEDHDREQRRVATVVPESLRHL